MEGLREEGREMRPEDGGREEVSKASKKEGKEAKRDGRKTVFMNLKNNPFLNSNKIIPTFSSVQFSLSVMSDSLRPHESQHARPPCPSPTPGVYSNTCPSIW